MPDETVPSHRGIVTLSAAKIRSRATGLRRRAMFPLERGNESGQRGGLLSATRVIEKEAGEWGTPVLQDPDQRSAREVIRDAVLCEPRETRAIERDLNHQLQIVHD